MVVDLFTNVSIYFPSPCSNPTQGRQLLRINLAYVPTESFVNPVFNKPALNSDHSPTQFLEAKTKRFLASGEASSIVLANHCI